MCKKIVVALLALAVSILFICSAQTVTAKTTADLSSGNKSNTTADLSSGNKSNTTADDSKRFISSENLMINSTYGIDVSMWQGDVDFAKAKENNVRAVYIRACVGTNIVDKYFERNYKKAKEAGLPYGFYHYVTARSEKEAKAQADFFANLIESKPYDMRATMDFENLSGLSPRESVSIAKAYLKRLEERLGHTPAVYSDSYDTANVWRSNLTAYPLWVAQYTAEPYTTGGWKTWSAFQYQDKGAVRGIHGSVGLDFFRQTIFLTDEEKDAAQKIRHEYSRENRCCECGDDCGEAAEI